LLSSLESNENPTNAVGTGFGGDKKVLASLIQIGCKRAIMLEEFKEVDDNKKISEKDTVRVGN
jgi:hypothetical protein